MSHDKNFDGTVHHAPAPDEADGAEVVVYPAEGQAAETAQALLDAAEDLDLDPAVVRTSDGAFIVPEAVADHASSALDAVDAGDDGEPAAEGYAALTVPQLQAEIDKRNADRGEAEQLSKAGKKADLVKVLNDDDAATASE